ncbi:MAG: hypothetical protein ACFFEN_07710 [Candidatus Thorarchaeota archaeon]
MPSDSKFNFYKIKIGKFDRYGSRYRKNEILEELLKWYVSQESLDEEQQISEEEVIERADYILKLNHSDPYYHIYRSWYKDVGKKAWLKAFETIIKYRHSKSKLIADWKEGLELINDALTLGETEELLSLKIQFLMNLNREEAAYIIAYNLLKKNTQCSAVQELKETNEYMRWKEAYLEERESLSILTPRLTKTLRKPWRKVVLWGWDLQGNPGYLILYGEHDFLGEKLILHRGDRGKIYVPGISTVKEKQKSLDTFIGIKSEKEKEPQETLNKYLYRIEPGAYKVFEKDVEYTHYAIFCGRNNRLPSFRPVKMISKKEYDPIAGEYKYRDVEMFEKNRALKKWRYWRYGQRQTDSRKKISTFYEFDPGYYLRLPYFPKLKYEDIIKNIKMLSIISSVFKVAESPNDILQLSHSDKKYQDFVVNLMSYQNIYMRRKFLSNLVDLDPPKSLYQRILEVGSSEVIAGLFLELARKKSTILEQEANNFIKKEINWVEEKYANGVKRCATIYLNSINPDLRKKRIKWITETVDEMDLKLVSIKGKDVKEEDQISKWRYHYFLKRGYIEFEKGLYLDGISFKYIKFKNTIQEAEIYGLAEVTGKIAYFLDAPRLKYYFEKKSQTSAHRYYLRYIRRVIDNFTKTDELKFIEAMKAMLTRYKPYDILERPLVNYLLGYYLYYDIKRNRDLIEDSFNWRYGILGQKKRLEFRKDIWDRHLETVAEIAIDAKVGYVLRMCYFIIKDSPNREKFIESLDYRKIIQLSLANFTELSHMFLEILENYLNSKASFEDDLMFALMEHSQLQELAKNYMNRTHGQFTPSKIVNFLYLTNRNEHLEYFRENILSLEPENYADFVKSFLSNSVRLARDVSEISEDFIEIIKDSTSKIIQLPYQIKLSLFDLITKNLFKVSELSEWIENYLEDLLLTIPIKDLEMISKEFKIDSIIKNPTPRNLRISSILKAIQKRKIPPNSEIIDILDLGRPKMIRLFLTIIDKYKDQLIERLSTVLLFFESEITILNNIANEIFEALSGNEKIRLHSIILDSPVRRAYLYGIHKLDEIYGENIPSNFILSLLEHSSSEVKSYISDKIDKIICTLGNGDKELFLYYINTLLYLPNKYSKSKEKVYNIIPQFAIQNKEKITDIEALLLDIGGSNNLADSERALVTLARIKMEVEYNTG